MILATFAAEQIEFLFKQIDLYLKYQEMGQSPEAFRENLVALEEAGFTPPPRDEWPPLYEDLPYEAQEALRLFYILPVLVDGMVGYLGKDLTVLPMFFDLYEVPEESRKTVLEIILIIINRSVAAAQDKAKAEEKKRSRANGS